MDKVNAVRATASFGAALAIVGVAPELQADIISLSFTPGSIGSAFPAVPVTIVELGATFSQFNDSYGMSVIAGDLDAVKPVSQSSTVSMGNIGNWQTPGIPAGTGVHYIAFAYQGNVGWFSWNSAGAGQTLTYLDGAYATDGESLHVGTPVPSPSGLALLALGAAGLRRKRSA